MQVVIFALQLSAGAYLISVSSNTSYPLVVISIALIALSYSLLSGLNSSIFTDALQYVVIVTSILILYFGIFSQQPVFFNKVRLFAPFDSKLLIDFGIPSALGLFLAIFADHQQWQRIFAIKKEFLISTYCKGAALHGLVTFSLGTLGVYIYRFGFKTDNYQTCWN